DAAVRGQQGRPGEERRRVADQSVGGPAVAAFGSGVFGDCGAADQALTGCVGRVDERAEGLIVGRLMSAVLTLAVPMLSASATSATARSPCRGRLRRSASRLSSAGSAIRLR